MATQDERISELNNKIATLEKEIKKNSVADYQKRQYLRLRYLAFVEAGAFCLFMGVGKELALFALIFAAITIPAGYLIIKKESREMQAQNDQRREIIKSLTNEKKLLEESVTPEEMSPASSAAESKRFSDTPDPALTLADPARPDIIGKDYLAIPPSREFQYTLFNKGGHNNMDGLSVNLFSGKMTMFTEELRNQGPSYYMDRRESSETVTDEIVRKFAKNESEEAGEKFASFTMENWKDYIPPNVMNEFNDTLKKYETPKTTTKDKPLKHRTNFDFDAYYIASHRAVGSCMVFLRRTDSGWRAFVLSPGCLGLSERNSNISEQTIKSCLEESKNSSDLYLCSDRKLTKMDMEYVSELMPESHPDEAISRKTASSPGGFSAVSVTAYYLKGKNWYPCANFKNIDEIYSRISNVAQYEIEYK